MKEKSISQMDALVTHIVHGGYDMIVVEGYDGVGKGKVIQELHERLGYPVYRPNYTFWMHHELPKKFRWMINASYLDILNSSGITPDPIIFDRGFLSGIVYNDLSLRNDHELLTKNLSIFYVIVTCDEESYKKFKEIRGVDDGKTYEECDFYSHMYEFVCENSPGMHYFIYQNTYEKEYGEQALKSCSGCGHYSYGRCMHPKKRGEEVHEDSPRCDDYAVKEVQDVELQQV